MNYPEDFINKVIQGDCLKVMKDIPDNSVDLVLTDPPYGIEYKRHIPYPRYEKIDNDNNLDWLPLVIKEMYRVLYERGNMYMFCNWQNVDIFKTEISKHFTIRNMLIWNKGGGGMGDLKTTYGSVYEICFFANKKPSKLNGRRDNDVINLSRSGNKFHPTEKPISLIGYLIRKSSNESDLILDPFLGSGTTAVAAKQLKRNFIGIEISPEYCKIANERLRVETLL